MTIGKIRLRISGYQFQPELEGKHFCHFFPALGQTVLAVEPLEQSYASAALELATLTAPLKPGEAFTLIKRQAEQPIDTGLASISETIGRIGIYRLTVILKDGAGHTQQQSLLFLAGIPVTKILIIIAGVLLVLVIGFVIEGAFKKQP